MPHSLVRKLEIGGMAGGSYADSFYLWNSNFYRVLKRRVVRHLEERGLDCRGSVEI